MIYFDDKRIQRALPQKPNEHPLPTPEITKPPLTVNYLDLLKRDYEKRRAHELSSIPFKPVANESEHLKLKRLLEQLKICTGHDLGEVERQEAAQVLDRLSPLEVSIADVALKIAAASLGCGLHASQYLTALTNHVLQARTKGSL